MVAVLATLLLLLTATPAAAQLCAAVLPASRSVQIGQPATAFATIINAGTATATGCHIVFPPGLPATVLFQTTNPTTNTLTGTANAPVDIPAGASQSFMFAATPTNIVRNSFVELTFSCDGQTAPHSTVNAWQLTATTGPTFDVLAIMATENGDEATLTIPLDGTAALAVAMVNIGGAGVPAGFGLAVGIAAPNLMVLICETNPNTGACLQLPGPGSAAPHDIGVVHTYTIFARSTGPILFSPSNTRVSIFVAFFSPLSMTMNQLFPLTSVAVRTP